MQRELGDVKISVNSSITASTDEDNGTLDTNQINVTYTKLNELSGAHDLVENSLLSEPSKPYLAEKPYSIETNMIEEDIDQELGESQEMDPCVGLANEPLRLCQLARHPPPVFHPQSLYAKVKSQEGMYTIAGISDARYSLLTCAPQPFFTRFSLRGEFFESPASWYT